MGQELRDVANLHERLIVHRGMNLVAGKRQSKIGGDKAARRLGSLELRPVPGFRQDAQIGGRPLVGDDARIAQRHGIILRAPDHQRGRFDFRQLPAQVVGAHRVITLGSHLALTGTARIFTQAHVIIMGDVGALGEGGRAHNPVAQADDAPFHKRNDETAQAKPFHQRDR